MPDASTLPRSNRVLIRLLRPSSPTAHANRLPAPPLANAGSVPGSCEGRHHSAYISVIRALKTSGRVAELEQLLLQLIDATEAEARHTNCAVASSYYGELARVYRRAGDIVKEHAILTRFARQTHAPGTGAARLMNRLSKLLMALAGDPQAMSASRSSS